MKESLKKIMELLEKYPPIILVNVRNEENRGFNKFQIRQMIEHLIERLPNYHVVAKLSEKESGLEIKTVIELGEEKYLEILKEAKNIGK